MGAWVVGDTISEITERMSSLCIFRLNTTKNIKQHLSVVKDKCPAPKNLDLKDDDTIKWVREVTNVVNDLFYLVDDLTADAAVHERRSENITSFFSALLQLKQIEKRLRQVASESSLNKVKMLTNREEAEAAEEPHLPSWRLKQCYDYFSFILPSSYDSMEADTVIRLWMAEGFLGPVIHSSSSSSLEPEDLGHQCIDELCRKNIVTVYGKGEIRRYISNGDPVGDAVGKHNLYVEQLPVTEVTNMVQRVAMDFELDFSNGIPKRLLETAKHMRTFLLPLFFNVEQPYVPLHVKLNWSACDSIFSKLKGLRVLTLKQLGIRRLPGSIGGLKSLRYLDLSYNNIKKLPNSMGKLNHLQTLLLSHCHRLQKLPDGINLSPSLRHLHLDHCLGLVCMPSALNKLTSLRTLPHFVASRRKGLGQLLYLNNIRGKLEISHLNRFKFKNSSKSKFFLKEKQHLQHLTLRWDHRTNSHEEEQVLSQLEPHSNLQRLSVMGYQGNQFPGWFSSLQNLDEISLYNCSNCKSLPSLHQIPKLTTLTLMSLDSLQFITNGDDSMNELPLKVVKISDCPNLTGWWEEGTQKNNLVFTSISELVLEYCPKLIHMPLFPALDDKLVLDSSNLKPLLDTLTHQYTVSDSSSPLSKLTQMTIINVDHQQYPPPPQGLLKNFTSLYHLHIRACEHLKSFTGWKNLSSLEELFISNCTEIDVPSEEWEGLENLSELVIEDIPDLENLPEGIKHLTSLNSLTIKRCPQLKDLTHHIHDLIHHQFQFLYIEDCPQLESLHLRRSDLIIMQITNCPSWLETQETDEEGPQDEKLVPPFSHLIH
ncbi:hypothetical protein VNO77_20872 [Canavalia gladiata]|uniref:Uncharacterized protein n=1 Tax=Canavalia gladiata TaxID=3824 RepID=A0AAN9QMV4_CANGL